MDTCNSCGNETNGICIACHATSGTPTTLAEDNPIGGSALAWLHPDAQKALAAGSLAAILRTWRSITGTRQSEVATALGYDINYISAIEHGRRDITNVSDRRRFASYLCLSPHLLGITDTESSDYCLVQL